MSCVVCSFLPLFASLLSHCLSPFARLRSCSFFLLYLHGSLSFTSAQSPSAFMSAASAFSPGGGYRSFFPVSPFALFSPTVVLFSSLLTVFPLFHLPLLAPRPLSVSPPLPLSLMWLLPGTHFGTTLMDPHFLLKPSPSHAPQLRRHPPRASPLVFRSVFEAFFWRPPTAVFLLGLRLERDSNTSRAPTPPRPRLPPLIRGPLADHRLLAPSPSLGRPPHAICETPSSSPPSSNSVALPIL